MPGRNEEHPMTTMYFVQGFRTKGRKLEPDLPQPAKSPEAAIAAAERMGPSRAGGLGLLRRHRPGNRHL